MALNGIFVLMCRYETTHSLTQPCRSVLDLPTPEGWKAEFTLVFRYTEMVYLSADSHPSKY